MRIADELAHRVLAYVSAVTEQGYRLSTDEVVTYIQAEMLDRATGGPRPEGSPFGVMGLLGTQLGVLGPGAALAHLKHLANRGWLHNRGQVVRISELGTAVLRSLDAREVEPETPLQVVLGASDPLAYAQVVQHIAQYSDALLVDPFFKLEHFPHIVHYTSVSRVLTGPKADIAGLSIALSTLPPDRTLEIRRTDKLHDRFVIPPSGPLLQLGTSFSGVGKNLTVLVELHSPAADEVRSAHEKLWRGAEPLEPVSPEAGSSGETKVPKRASEPKRRPRKG